VSLVEEKKLFSKRLFIMVFREGEGILMKLSKKYSLAFPCSWFFEVDLVSRSP